jgi:hypothetical protein
MDGAVQRYRLAFGDMVADMTRHDSPTDRAIDLAARMARDGASDKAILDAVAQIAPPPCKHAQAATVVSDILAATPPRIRIAHKWGHGDWHHAADRADLESTCHEMNAKYGPGTHRIEVENG